MPPRKRAVDKILRFSFLFFAVPTQSCVSPVLPTLLLLKGFTPLFYSPTRPDDRPVPVRWCLHRLDRH